MSTTQRVSIEKQGMLSILGSVSDQTSIKASIRRTLSADMSSKKWFNKIASSSEEVIQSDSSFSDDEKLNEDPQPKAIFDVWSSILSKENTSNEKYSSSNNVPPPYIHPLVKRSNSCLSKQSLEICTESLGSETGSDCFSSSPSIENVQPQQHYSSVVSESFEDFHVIKYNNTKRILSSSPRSFPPPLPSVHMQSRRQDGRLILEAVPAPPKDCLHAQRLDGRLLLTYIDQSNESELEIMENHGGEGEQVFDDIEDETHLIDNDGDDEDKSQEVEVEVEVEVEGKGVGIVMDQSPRLSSGMTILCENSTLVPYRFNNSVNPMIERSIVRECYTCPSSVPQSLPSPRRTTSFNAYEYFWRKKNNPIIDDKCNKNSYYSNKQAVVPQDNGSDPKAISTTNKEGYEQKDLVVSGGNKASTNKLVPYLRSCKEPRRPMIIREPYCIATS